MAEFRVLVTGSRDWLDRQRIFGALDAILAQCGMQPRRTLVVVHGDAPGGADAIARRWCYVKLGATAADVREERHPADWGSLGKRAGMARNAEMVSAGADLCLAYIAPCRSPKCDGKPRSPGTSRAASGPDAGRSGAAVRDRALDRAASGHARNGVKGGARCLTIRQPSSPRPLTP